MKGGVGLLRLAWVLLGLLAIASAAFELNKPSSKEAPYAASFDPAGAAALAELLRQDGYSVDISSLVPVSIPKDTLAIAYVQRGDISLPLTDAAASGSPDRQTSPPPQDAKDLNVSDSSFAPPIVGAIVTHLRAGGSALLLGYDPDLTLVDHKTVAVRVTDPSGTDYQATLPDGVTVYSEDLADSDAKVPAWTCANQPFANLDQIGPGRAIVLGEGEVAMNSLIDQTDNARFLLDLVHLAAPQGSKVLLIDGGISGQAAGLVDVLGPWARGAELQLALVCVVVVYTLGKRFGLADETPRTQRGARDLLEGIADTYARGRASKAGLQALTEDADRAVRSQLKLAQEAPVRKRNDLLPPATAQALTACEHALMQELTPSQALELARRLETELEVFLRHRKTGAKRRRRSVNSA